MVEHSINWIRGQKAHAPDKPSFLYFSTGATHAPHQVPKEWSDKYKGKFDQGWDKLREETFARQKQLGVIPANAKILPKYFRGTIEKVEFNLGPAKLSAEDLRRIYLERFASAGRN